MDVDLNTLQYLTEPALLNKLTKSDKKSSLDQEIKFYKKRIYAMTKKLLLKSENDVNDDIHSAFENYARVLIQHFKIVDTNDILQEEFKNFQVESQETNITIDKEATKNADKLIINQPKPKENNLKEFVKTVKCKPKEQLILPKKRVINLKTKDLKNKV